MPSVVRMDRPVVDPYTSKAWASLFGSGLNQYRAGDGRIKDFCGATNTERPNVMHSFDQNERGCSRLYYGTYMSEWENNSAYEKTGGVRHSGEYPAWPGTIMDVVSGDRLFYHSLASPVENAHASQWGYQRCVHVTPGSNITAPAIVQQAIRGFCYDIGAVVVAGTALMRSRSRKCRPLWEKHSSSADGAQIRS